MGDGSTTISNSTFSGNSALEGGSIYISGGPLTITNSTFTNNSAFANGGAIDCDTAAVINDSTFIGNSAVLNGGGVLSNAGLNVSNSTFAGNSSLFGAGVANFGSIATISDSTFSDNSAISDPARGEGGGGIGTEVGTTIVSNSILTGNSGGNCVEYNGGTLSNGGYNISDDGSCGLSTASGADNQVIGDNVTPFLSPNGLQNNGGLTQTIALQPNGPAIGAIPADDCPAADQRGSTRPAPGEDACSIGAFEYSPPISPLTTSAIR